MPATFADADAVEAASREVTLDPQNGLAMNALAATHYYRADFAEAERWARRAVEQYPYDPDALVQLGWQIVMRGNFDEGIPLVESAIARSIRPPGWYFHTPTIKAYIDGDKASSSATVLPAAMPTKAAPHDQPASPRFQQSSNRGRHRSSRGRPTGAAARAASVRRSVPETVRHPGLRGRHREGRHSEPACAGGDGAAKPSSEPAHRNSRSAPAIPRRRTGCV